MSTPHLQSITHTQPLAKVLNLTQSLQKPTQSSPPSTNSPSRSRKTSPITPALGPVTPLAKISALVILTTRMPSASARTAAMTVSTSSSAYAPPKTMARGTLRSATGSAALLPRSQAGARARSPAQRAGSSEMAEGRVVQMWTTGGMLVFVKRVC